MRIPGRFNGPLDSANGGIAAGLLAAHLDSPTVEVTLRSPPPLDTDLHVEDGRLYDGEVLIAEARASSLELDAPRVVLLPEATAATLPDLAVHAFPQCFVCGTGRDDGLRLLAGPVGPGHVAAAWTPGVVPGLEPAALVWGALDCPGGFAAELATRPMLLGRFTCRIDRLPEAGRPHVVQGWHIATDGRKVFTGSALSDANGHVLAVARATWIRPAT